MTTSTASARLQPACRSSCSSCSWLARRPLDRRSSSAGDAARARRDTAALFILATGVTFVIMLGGIDLSLQSMASLASVVVALYLPPRLRSLPWPCWAAPSRALSAAVRHGSASRPSSPRSPSAAFCSTALLVPASARSPSGRLSRPISPGSSATLRHPERSGRRGLRGHPRAILQAHTLRPLQRAHRRRQSPPPTPPASRSTARRCGLHPLRHVRRPRRRS